ncbi:hypothetical protein KOW79_013528 [Hemibagrus wyckioides]|uniref:Uncharacterized protein n=1 Tax=Hemibagrus wyckioides TaxID=337641 RepID=A0A9D3SGT9_9TELE|nr:hypothetical protein KOW79_013528 [Hemibagrus wyckioides]
MGNFPRMRRRKSGGFRRNVKDIDFHAHQKDCSWRNFRETLRGLCTRSFTYFLQGISLLTRPQETASGAGVKGELQAKPRRIKPQRFILRKHMKEGRKEGGREVLYIQSSLGGVINQSECSVSKLQICARGV